MMMPPLKVYKYANDLSSNKISELFTKSIVNYDLGCYRESQLIKPCTQNLETKLKIYNTNQLGSNLPEN